MVDKYLDLEPAPEYAVFHVRLGLCIADLAAGPAAEQVTRTTVRIAHEAGDAYAAHDVLSHTACRSRTTSDTTRALTDATRRAGLHRGTMPPDLRHDLMESVKTSETSIAAAIAATPG